MIHWLHKKLFMLRWGAVARRWPVERLLAATDLDLDPEERKVLAHGIHSWRELIAWYLDRFDPMLPGSQFYCFGVAHGGTAEGLAIGHRMRNRPLPHMHMFDSFEGLPAEDPGIAVPAVWEVGAYAGSQEGFHRKLAQIGIPGDGYATYPGWFSETLKAELVENGTFQTAAYVDIDADLYNSTMDVFDFMFTHDLIRPGTLVGYDDWGDTDLWTAGESRAHKEIEAKYDVRFAQLFSWGEPPLMHKLFLVVSVGNRRIG